MSNSKEKAAEDFIESLAVHKRHDQPYVPMTAIPSIMAYCAENNLAILGIDAFILDPPRFIATSFICDFSPPRGDKKRVPWKIFQEKTQKVVDNYMQMLEKEGESFLLEVMIQSPYEEP
ncbi:MAG: hypothetical protein ACO1RX_16715 [Candidatus Sericytochromatia bacterium]